MLEDKTKNNPVSEDDLLLEEIGSLALESANLEFLTTADESEQAAFIKFVEENAEDEELLPKILAKFPYFEEILNREVAEIRADLEEMKKL